ncbi:MAG: PAS domain S-box protein [Anaerolineaceae bacterium]|nr:MAG: PAS domain S-box protein [Anaerolineaceae bacterium]
MSYRFTPYLLLLFISGLMSLSLGVYTIIKHRHAKGATSFAIAMFIVTLWSIPNALEMSAIALGVKLFWANVQYTAYCFSPVALLILCLDFSGYEKYINYKKLYWIFIIPTITIILVWTDKYHGLVRNNIHMDYSGVFPVIGKQYGSFFYVHAIYSHSLNLTTIFILLRTVFSRKTIYRKQAVALLIGVSLVVIPNVFYITGLSPIKGYDITPVFFGPAGIIMAWSILRYRMFDLVPLARATVIENMEAGVMVLDLQDRILDINPTCADIIGLPMGKITSKHIYEVCEFIPEFISAINDKTVSRVEFNIAAPNKQIVYEALLSMLKDKNGCNIGRLVVIYDITEKKIAEKEYYDEQWKLAVNNERNRMVRDLHDNLGQVLGYINLQAQAIQKELNDAHEDLYSNKLDKLIEVAQTAHHQIREYIHDVRNSDLIEIDFIAALDKEINNFELQTAIKVARKITPEFRSAAIAPSIRIHILNIIKEAMNNVRKHAQAENILMSCDYVDNNLLVIIYDDGKGFDAVDSKELKQGFGLSIIQERTSEMGGTCEIKSKPGEGSSIRLRVPLDGGKVNAV